MLAECRHVGHINVGGHSREAGPATAICMNEELLEFTLCVWLGKVRLGRCRLRKPQKEVPFFMFGGISRL